MVLHCRKSFLPCSPSAYAAKWNLLASVIDTPMGHLHSFAWLQHTQCTPCIAPSHRCIIIHKLQQICIFSPLALQQPYSSHCSHSAVRPFVPLFISSAALTVLSIPVLHVPQITCNGQSEPRCLHKLGSNLWSRGSFPPLYRPMAERAAACQAECKLAGQQKPQHKP